MTAASKMQQAAWQNMQYIIYYEMEIKIWQ